MATLTYLRDFLARCTQLSGVSYSATYFSFFADRITWFTSILSCKSYIQPRGIVDPEWSLGSTVLVAPRGLRGSCSLRLLRCFS